MMCEKNEFKIKVVNMKDSSDDIQEEYANEYSVFISAWELNESELMDFNITEKFPKLMEKGFKDISTGCMVYSGDMTRKEVSDYLENEGFILN